MNRAPWDRLHNQGDKGELEERERRRGRERRMREAEVRHSKTPTGARGCVRFFLFISMHSFEMLQCVCVCCVLCVCVLCVCLVNV